MTPSLLHELYPEWSLMYNSRPVPTEKILQNKSALWTFVRLLEFIFWDEHYNHPQKDALCSLIRQLFKCYAVLNQPRTC